MTRLLHLLARVSLVLALTLAGTSGALASAQPPHTPSAPYSPGVVLVGFDPGASLPEPSLAPQAMPGAMGDVMRQVGAVSAEPLFGGLAGKDLQSAGTSGVYRLRLANGADVMAAVRALSATDGIAYAEPDYVAQTLVTPNDPRYGEQWGPARIGAPAAWDVSTGYKETVIAIIDSGLDASHADLAGRLWANPGEIAGNGLDDDNNGKVDDVSGWDFLADSANLSDSTGHGTQVAGIIAATGNNGQGIAGLCWNCRVMVLKVTDSATANYSDIVEAVAYAAEKRADVINISLGGSSDSTTLRNAIEAAAGTSVVVAGAGNDGSESPFYPAAYETALGVSGVDAADAKVPSSNYGPWVSLAAPGINILTTLSGGGYGPASGTSMAAAFVSGAAALVRSHHPDWSGPVARAQLLQTATVIDAANPGLAGKLGRGRVNAGAALTIAAVPKFIVTGHQIADQDGAPLAVGAANNLVVELRNDWLDATSVTATLSTADAGVTITKPSAGFGAIPSGGSVANAGDPFQVTIAAGAYGRAITFGLRLVADGKTSNVSFTVNTESVVATLPATISTDTTLTSDRVWLAANSVKVNAGVTLTIQPGTTIKFAAGTYLVADYEATLIADGTSDAPIVFTSAAESPQPGDWGGWYGGSEAGVILRGNTTYDGAGEYAGGTVVRHAVVQYSRGGISAGQAYVANSLIWENTGTAVTASGAHLRNNRIVANHGGGWVVDLRGDANGAVLEGNLISGNDGGVRLAIFAGQHVLTDNTIYGNQGGDCCSRRAIVCVTGQTAPDLGGEPPALEGNNFAANLADYDVAMDTCSGATSLAAPGNYWGTTDTAAIQDRIYDSYHNFDAPTFTFTPFLTEPSRDAPPFLHDLTLSPASPIGLQKATFTLRFSAPMDQSVEPLVSFHNTRSGTWSQYTTTDSGLPHNMVNAIAEDTDGSMWFGTDSGAARFAGGEWTSFTPDNSGLAINRLLAVTVDPAGDKWFGGFSDPAGVSAVRYDGASWSLYGSGPGCVPGSEVLGPVYDVAFAGTGSAWFAADGFVPADGATPSYVGVANYDGVVWHTYTQDEHNLGQTELIAVAPDGTVWAALVSSTWILRLDGSTWSWYEMPKDSSTVMDPIVGDLAVAEDGALWVASETGVWRFDGGSWQSACPGHFRAIAFGPDNTIWATGRQQVAHYDGTDCVYQDLPSYYAESIAVDRSGNVWVGTSQGLAVLWSWVEYGVTDNGRWLDDRTWQATYDITSLVPRGDYVISVSGARGLDGMEIPADERFSFTVDYAGTISDGTPPASPNLYASGVAGDASAVYARWSAADPDSAITLYRYAVGASDGATDIVSWTETTATSLSRSGLGLVAGRRYWLGVQARNSGGLWSGTTWLAFTAGEVSAGNVYLPLATK